MSIPPPGAPAIVPGHRLDRYELLCPLAHGGMASVWIARQTGKHGFEKLVAVKMILPQFASDERFQKMFLDEAHIAAGIEHPNVAQILDLGEEHGVLYLAMEWIDGDSLSKLQKLVEKQDATIPPAIVARIMIETCAGLHAAHELRGRDGDLLRVVHRDVSPQNVLVSTKGISKVIDFGIAKARDRVAGETNSGVLKGKIRYMAPEQALGGAMDRRADVWAVGAVLYHLLSNRLPFDGPNDVAAVQRLVSGRPPVPLPASVPRPLAELVKAVLVHDPEKRIATCSELQHRLEAAMSEASLRATNADVATFASQYLAARARARKEAVDVALAAAAERARIQSLLQLKESPSSSGQYSLAVTNLAKLGSERDAASAPASVPPSNATIGGLATATTVTRSKTRILAIGGIAAAVVCIGAFALATHRRSQDATEPASAKPAPCVGASTSAPVPPTAPTAPQAAGTSVATASAVVASAPSVVPPPPPPAAVATAAKPAAKSSATKPTKSAKAGKPSDVDDGF